MAQVGRPLKFKTKEELQSALEGFFAKCDEKERPYTISGLALHLDVDTETIRNYEKKAEFFGTVNRARQMCENYVEEGLLTNKINPSAGNFNLKNNYGWKDKTEQDITSQGEKLSFTIAETIAKKNDITVTKTE